MTSAITDREFERFQGFIHGAAGITLSSAKKALVSGRLAKRLQHHKLERYTDYLALLDSGQAADEVQIAIDLLTTNETYFFRESKHFDLLRQMAADAPRAQTFRVWSAACSSGEEPYSMAMVLADVRSDRPWEVLGSDISSRVLKRARAGHYPMERARQTPPAYLKRFCLKGKDEQEGTLLITRTLRDRVRLLHVNLNETLPGELGTFDMVFLRNVMIYFNAETKRQVVERVLGTLRRGGIFVVGHSESLNGMMNGVQQVSPSIYRKL
ncbi:protein-glutamate O-methyltransferase CheR [Aquincola sp. MAHUQ-54]|uniref:Chemotaxis protein methyltransferase n=1 Tax=Aquincola agrisoli TaxID=3119538 RepID=A0AAW9Q920_9BURK